MAATGADLKTLLTCIAGPGGNPAFQRLFMSRLYPNCDGAGRLSIVGPLMGASYGAALLETLIAWGGKHFLFLGWCGSISSQLSAGDLLLHIRSERRDLNYLLLKRIMQTLSGCVCPVEEVDGFRYLDSRDLTGFVDGTENPEGDERAAVALVDDDDEFNGGSYINLQRWERSGPYVKLMAELGVRMNEVFLDWLKHAREEILKEGLENGDSDRKLENPLTIGG